MRYTRVNNDLHVLVFMAFMFMAALVLLSMMGSVSSGTVAKQQAQVPALPAWGELTWRAHGAVKHGDDFYQALRRLEVCDQPQAYFCGPVTGDTSQSCFIAFCEVHAGSNLCAGAVVGRYGVGQTAYIAPCIHWYSKVAECQATFTH